MISNNTFTKLFEKIQLGTMELKNRIVMPAMGNNYAGDGGYVSQRTLDYYEARAQGGVGLIILGITAVSLEGRINNTQLTIADDSYITGLRQLAEIIQHHGARAAVQLHHGGRQIMERVTGHSPVSPSPIPTLTGEMPHELTIDEIQNIVKQFADGAKRAQEAGFDGVEIHGAHQYLISSFLSSATNTRDDQYGGSLENKARFLTEILQATRKATEPNFSIWVRLSGEEYGMDNGITIEETKKIVPILINAGTQAIHVSAYGIRSFSMKAPSTDTAGSLIPLAHEVKTVSSVPVIAVGRLNPELAEKVLEDNKADLVALGRSLITDPKLPNKVAAGQLEDINPCIGCLECLERHIFAGTDTVCTVNAAMGREGEYQIIPAKKKKKVVVIGGGPAGMETARVAALRGHQVILFEKAASLGGQLAIASVPPYKHDIHAQMLYLINQVNKTGVDTRVNEEATPEKIMQVQPDCVIIATGSKPLKPDIAGVDSPSVVQANDALSGNANIGKKVIIIGGGMVGCETGHYLAEQGKDVTIIEVAKRLASDMFPIVRRRLMDGLRSKKVTMLALVTCREINESGVTVTTAENETQTFPADTVVLAVGYQANDNLFKKLQGKVTEIYNIGDSAEPKRIMEAINDGFRTGLSL